MNNLAAIKQVKSVLWLSVMKLLLVIVFAYGIGWSAGTATVLAEAVPGVYVVGYGNIGTAQTTGWYSSPTYTALGRSSTSTSIPYMRAELRFWHLEAMEANKITSCSYCTSTQTANYSTAVWGEFATQSQFTGFGTTTYYTSYPDGSFSCSNHYFTGSGC